MAAPPVVIIRRLETSNSSERANDRFDRVPIVVVFDRRSARQKFAAQYVAHLSAERAVLLVKKKIAHQNSYSAL